MSKLDIHSEIKNCWQEKLTGALFLKLTNGKLLQLFFESGELKSIKYQGLMGMEALREVYAMAAVKSQFHQGAVSRITNKLPATVNILSMITNDVFEQSSATNSAFVGRYLSDKEESLIRRILIDYVGPIADIVFSDG